LEVIGVGGMGIVFRAEDSRLKRQIVLKAMKPAVAASLAAKDRFLREAQAAAAIEHDNIVHIYQVGEDRQVPDSSPAALPQHHRPRSETGAGLNPVFSRSASPAPAPDGWQPVPQSITGAADIRRSRSNRA
jgi:serine/threonine protein kinase